MRFVQAGNLKAGRGDKEGNPWLAYHMSSITRQARPPSSSVGEGNLGGQVEDTGGEGENKNKKE